MSDEELQPSKSSRKRERQELRVLGEKLVRLSDDQLATIGDDTLLNAIRDCRRIKRGNARKRQIQYIGKLLSRMETGEIRAVIDRYDASSESHVRKFHQLEKWRETLMQGDYTPVDEIASQYPDLDRQHLKQLVRRAIEERRVIESGDGAATPIQYRKLFQYLKTLSDWSDNPAKDF